MAKRDRSLHCWICGRPRGLEVRRESWQTNLTPVFVPRTNDPTDSPAQILNDLRIGAYVYRNGGANEETHICGKCLTIGLRAIKVEVSNLLDELGESHAMEEQLVEMTERLASVQARMDRVCHEHNRMQERLNYALSKVPAEEFVENDELRYARWEVMRGPVARLGDTVIEGEKAAPMISEAARLAEVLHEILEDERCAIPGSLRDRALDALPCAMIGKQARQGGA